MRSNVVNRLKLDFTCSTEAYAGSLQRELTNFTLPGIEAIISQVFREQENAPDIVIERITIELGNIEPADLNSAELLENFKNAFSAQIFASCKHVLESETRPKGEAWMIVKAFLLTGDIPWWVEKERQPDINRLLQRVMEKTPKQVWSFMARYGQSSTIRHRIWSQFSAANVKILLEPEGITTDECVKLMLARHIDILNFLVQTAKERINDVLKLLLFKTALQNDGTRKLIVKQMTSWFDKEQMLIVQEVRAGRQPSLASIQQDLKKISFQQLEFLLQASKSGSANKLLSPITRGSAARTRRITSIAEILGWDSTALLQDLTKYNTQQLVQFEKTLNLRSKPKSVKSRLIRMLISEPDFFKPELLFLAEKLFAWSAWSAPEVSAAFMQPQTSHQKHRLIKKESSGQDFTYSILQHTSQYQEEDKTLLLRKLGDLPDHFLQLMAGLICLDKGTIDEIAAIVQVSAVDDKGQESAEGHSVSADGMKFIVENAGLVLIAPYFPTLFRFLGYLEGNKFKNTDYQTRAVYIIQYIFNRTHNCPEYLLQLNKVLCGFAPQHVVPWNKRRLNKKEKDEADDVIASAIDYWKSLGNTSLDGFRAAFLKRKGLLTEYEGHWGLQVEKKTYDVLLSELPWSISLIKLPWMDKPIEVEW